MFQDYSIDDYKKACYIILRPDLTPEYFIRHFGMSRYEYSICQQRLKELQKFYGIEYHFEENRIHWTVTDEKQFQQHYKGMLLGLSVLHAHHQQCGWSGTCHGAVHGTGY